MLSSEVGEALGGGSLWYTFYNFCRVQKSLRVTSAVQAGIAYHQWRIEDLLN